ncbi:hypothetical protein K0U73_09130 [bacterium]|nr:hypothetical protein [bacterium]
MLTGTLYDQTFHCYTARFAAPGIRQIVFSLIMRASNCRTARFAAPGIRQIVFSLIMRASNCRTARFAVMPLAWRLLAFTRSWATRNVLG